jgi:ABC-type multidrug transport system ATPase subunit
MTAPPLQVRGLSFAYPRRAVLDGWSADFHAGITWVRGSNGSGKSTLLKLLAGALPPLLGQIQALGIDAVAQPLAYRREVFWCGPGAIAFDHLRPPEYAAFLRSLYPRLDAAAFAAHAAALGLQPYLGTRLAALSTGTQRKVWLAAALAVATPVVLLDEPLNALDAASLAYLLQRLADAASERRQAWVVASHEPFGAAAAQAALIELDRPAAGAAATSGV